MKVVLILKLADRLDGIDVSVQHVGDVLDLPDPQGRLLIAENWAMPDRRHSHGPPPLHDRRRSHELNSATATDNSTGQVFLPGYLGQRCPAEKDEYDTASTPSRRDKSLIDVIDHLLGNGIVVDRREGGAVMDCARRSRSSGQ